MHDLKRKMAIVIMSCDAFSDVWDPFFTLFQRFWPECPFEVYLISENKEVKNFPCKTILPGLGKNWSDRLIYALQQLEEKYVLFLQEDYFINKPVDTKWITEILLLCEKKDLVNVRLYPTITSELIKLAEFPLGRIDKEKEQYVVCTQATIWSREFMLSILGHNESVWDVERNGSLRAKEMPHEFYSVYPTTDPDKLDEGYYPVTYLFLTSVTRGKWTMKTVKYCRQNGIFLNMELRKANSYIDEFYMNRAPLWARHVIDFVNHRLKLLFGINIREYPI